MFYLAVGWVNTVMPPKKRSSGSAQNKELKSAAESASPDKKESPELSLKKWVNSCLHIQNRNSLGNSMFRYKRNAHCNKSSDSNSVVLLLASTFDHRRAVQPLLFKSQACFQGSYLSIFASAYPEQRRALLLHTTALKVRHRPCSESLSSVQHVLMPVFLSLCCCLCDVHSVNSSSLSLSLSPADTETRMLSLWACVKVFMWQTRCVTMHGSCGKLFKTPWMIVLYVFTVYDFGWMWSHLLSFWLKGPV